MKQSVAALAGWLDRVGGADALAGLAGLLPDAAVFAVDEERRLVHWSAGAERLLGFRAAEVLGEHCLKANRCRQCMVGCGIAEHRRVDDVPLELYAADGSVVRVRKTATAFFDDDRFLGGVEVLRPDRTAAPAPQPERGDTEAFHGMLTADPELKQVFRVCRNVAATDAPVLVRGESGSGKELLARAIHAESPRAAGPFVAVNCAAMTASLMESELFGHVRGAFTGAVADRPGIFARAHGGTLFLDEVAELPLALQAKLLRVLEDGAVTPVGGTRARSVDVRVVAATHQSLRRMVAEGRFREDLMFRLRVVPLFLPPLRSRPRDVTALLWRFVARRNEVGPRRVDAVAPDAMRALLDHGWPGNVRELKNVVDYAFAVGRGREILRAELPPELRDASAPTPHGLGGEGPTAMAGRADADSAEAQRIRAALEAAGGHVGRAAELLGISRPTLWRRRKRLGLLADR